MPGFLLQNRHRLLDWYTELLSDSPTQTILVQRFGAPRTIVTANPNNVEYILKTNFTNYPKGLPFTEILGDFLGRGIFNVDGELWNAQRKLASHEFSTKSLREFVTLAFDTIGSVLGADPIAGADLSHVPVLVDSFDTASQGNARDGSRLCGLEKQESAQFGIREEAEGKRETRSQPLLIAGHEDEVVRDMVISFLMAGRDTTSSALTWLFWLTTNHPDVKNQMIDEITSINNGDKALEFDDLKEMKYLHACLNESMRLYPPVAWDSKHAAKDDII
ncbi:hypothetical protein HAX54_009541 [Datura stramonium]|uniref:Cytochrome P450 n=1 Tax=Datura stramonium TaxID=4076 RepID=A0ABS8RWZ2_DATST|nr:hypothetical protein [Datura stramonium]